MNDLVLSRNRSWRLCRLWRCCLLLLLISRRTLGRLLCCCWLEASPGCWLIGGRCWFRLRRSLELLLVRWLLLLEASPARCGLLLLDWGRGEELLRRFSRLNRGGGGLS